MVIVGAGHAGGRAAQALRAKGWNGPLVLIGSESLAPYERPPLSKGVLVGDKTVADCALFNAGFLAECGIDYRPETTVIEIQRDHRAVRLSDGATISYDRLLLATGAEPRRLNVAGGWLDGVCYLRTAVDAQRLESRLGPGTRIVIVGGGFVGLEVAASATARGCRVAVIEAGPRVLMRAVPPEISERVALRHRAAGVDLRIRCRVAAIGGDDRVAGVWLDDGGHLDCDVVLIAVGVEPRVELARAAGLAVDNGIVVDRALRTGDPNIFAAGDACSFSHELFGARIRLEAWKNAEEQGPLAARNMLGAGEPCCTVPWMWSDQYDIAIQIAGLPELGRRNIQRPIGDGALLIFHLMNDGRIIGASGVGPNGTIGRGVRLGQMMIERRLYPDVELLADSSVNLKTMLTAEAA